MVSERGPNVPRTCLSRYSTARHAQGKIGVDSIVDRLGFCTNSVMVCRATAGCHDVTVSSMTQTILALMIGTLYNYSR